MSIPFHFQFLIFVLVGTIRILILNAIHVLILGVAFYPKVESNGGLWGLLLRQLINRVSSKAWVGKGSQAF